MALTQVTSIGLKDGEIVNADLHSAASVALSKLASTGALGSAITATTQSASDDSTKLATTAFVQAAVTSLIDGAPGSLNTLNELAAAINDDSSYATTLTTALATKLPLAGGTLTGDTTLANTKKVIFNHSSGAGAFIKHQSGHFEIISSVGNTYFASAGTLYLRTNGSTNALTLDTSQNATFAGTATFAGGTCNGSFTVSSTEPRIYLTDTNNNSDFEIRNVDGIFRIFDSTNTRNCLAIDSSGDTTFAGKIYPGGNIHMPDNVGIKLGASDDLIIYHVANSHTYIDSQGSSQDIFIRGKRDIYIAAGDNAGSYHTSIYCDNNGGVRLSYDNSPKLYTKSFGVQIEMSPRMDLYGTGNNIELKFITNSGTHRGSVYADNGNTIGFLKAGTGSWAARWHSDGKQTAHGDIVPNADTSQTLGNSSYQWSSIYGQNLISRTGYPLQFYANNTYAGRITTYGEWRLQTTTASDNSVSTDHVHGIGNAALDSVTSNLARLVMQERTGVWISFKNGSGTHYGSIYLSGSNVVYGGTSDYRLKENVAPLAGAITTLKLLKPITYTWNELSKFDNTDTHRGFLAHEVQEIEPDAVTGSKDGMTISGNCVDESGKTTQVNVPEAHKKEGETWTKTTEVIDIQQLDERKLIPILTAALQEAVTKIETLETKVAALEAG